MSPQPPGPWPETAGNWEGGTIYNGRLLHHEPYTGWVDAGPAHTSRAFIQPPGDPTETSRVWNPTGQRLHYGGRYPRPRHRLTRWLAAHRYGVVAATAVLVVLGYATTLWLTLERTLPTFRVAAALVAVGAVLVTVLLSVVLWARRG